MKESDFNGLFSVIMEINFQADTDFTLFSFLTAMMSLRDSLTPVPASWLNASALCDPEHPDGWEGVACNVLVDFNTVEVIHYFVVQM